LITSSLTRKINFYRDTSFGYRQDTKVADPAGQRRLFYANYLFYNKGIWAKKASFLLFLILLPEASPAKALAFDASKYCSKNHNVGFLQNAWAKYAMQTV
jgi:hypothetical protein